MTTHELPATSADSATPSVLAWWGGFVVGPLCGIAVWLSSAPHSLARAHGRAATILWTVLLAFWVPFSAWVILFGQAEPIVLVEVVPVVVIVGLIGCINGTIQAMRSRTPLGNVAEGP